MGKINIWPKLSLIVVVFAALFAVILFAHSADAATGINSQISFQGKVVNTNGTNVADGTYNLQFKIYQDGTNTGSGGTLKWTESRLISASQGVTVTAGTFQVNLGSITALSGIDFNQDTLWLSMNVGGTATTPTWDGEMTPFIRLTAVPYAVNAGTVGGLSASQLVQLTPAGGTQTGNVNVSGNITSTTGSVTAGSTLSVGSATAPTGGAAYINGNVGIGTASIIGQLQVESSTYRSNQLLLNNGVTGTPPAYPNGYLPSLSVVSSQTSASRPLFFGYTNAGAYSVFLTSGACGAFTQMCLDFGTGTTALTALENMGNVLKVGGGDDGNFTYVNLQGNVGVGNSNSPSLFSVGSTSQFQVSSTGAVTAVGLNSGSGLIQGTGGLTINGTTTLSNLTTAGILLNNGSGVVSSLADVATGSCLTSAGIGVSPAWGSCGSGGAGANTALSNLASVAINTSLLPGSDNTIDIGSSSNSFRTGYFDTSVLTALLDAPASGSTLNIGTTNSTTLNIGPVGTTAVATATNLATSNGAAQDINIGGTGLAGGSNSGTVTSLQGGSSVLWVTNAGIYSQSLTNSSTAFQVQNASGAAILSIDTTSTGANGSQVNYLAYPGFETGSFSNANAGWAAVSPATVAQNTSKTFTYNGQYSAVLTTTTGNGGMTTSSFAATPPGSTTYIVSFYARVTAGSNMNSNAFSITTTGGAAGPTACTGGTTLTTTNTGFQRITCSIATGSGSITALTISQTDSVARTIYIDAIQMQTNSFNGNTITAPTPYQIGAIQLRGIITNPLTLLNNGDSTTAFQIQNANGTSNLLVADTLNGRIMVGTSATTMLSVGVSGTPTTQFSVGGATGAFGVASSGNITTSASSFTASNAYTISANAGNALTVSTATGLLTLGSNTGTISILAPTYTTSTKGVQIGSATAAANPTLLLLNQATVASGSETANTCSATVNLGALYYNTSSNAIRSCINGAWEDLISTSGLGVMAFGIVPDSGNNPGDMQALGGTAHQTGPCKVYWTSATSVSVAPCVAYTAGHKVVLTAATAVTLTNATAGNYQHICFSTAAGVAANIPAALTSSAEGAGFPAFSLGNPVLCIADVYYAGANNTISAIYDTRVFTTTTKEFDVTSTALGIGYPACYGTSTGILTSCGTAGLSVAGIVVATNGATSTTTPNIVLASGGPTNAKATLTGNVAGDIVQTSATANRLTATIAASGTPNAAFDANLGINRITSPGTACTATANLANCDYQFFFSQQKR